MEREEEKERETAFPAFRSFIFRARVPCPAALQRRSTGARETRREGERRRHRRRTGGRETEREPRTKAPRPEKRRRKKGKRGNFPGYLGRAGLRSLLPRSDRISPSTSDERLTVATQMRGKRVAQASPGPERKLRKHLRKCSLRRDGLPPMGRHSLRDPVAVFAETQPRRDAARACHR